MRPLLALSLSLVSVLSSALLVHAQTPNALNRVGYYAELAEELELAESMWRQLISIESEASEPGELENGTAYVSLGYVLLQQKKWADAQAVFEAVMQQAPDSEGAQLGLGRALRQQGQFEAAQAAFESVIQQDVRSPYAYSFLGRMQRDLKQFAEAEANFAKIIALEPGGPNAAQAYWDLGKTYAAQNNLEAAERSHRRALGLNPDRIEFWESLSSALRSQGRSQELASIAGEISRIKDSYESKSLADKPLQRRYSTEADQAQVTDAKQTLQASPDNVSASIKLGVALRNLGQFAESEAALQQAVASNPNNPLAQYALSQTLTDLGRDNEAQSALLAAQRLYGNDELPTLNQGFREYTGIAFQVNQFARSVPPVEAPPTLSRQSSVSQVALSRLPLPTITARPATGIARAVPYPIAQGGVSLEDAIRWNPDNADMKVRLAEQLRSQGDFAGAATALREAARLDPTKAVLAYNNLGAVLFDQGQLAEAEATFAEARTQSAGQSLEETPTLYNNLGFLFTAQGNWGEAVELYQEAKRLGLEVPPFSPSWDRSLYGALVSQARSLVATGSNAQQAERAYRSAIRLYTNQSETSDIFDFGSPLFDELGTLLYTQGKLQEAEAVYTEAMSLYPESSAFISRGLVTVLSAQGRTEEASALAELYRPTTTASTRTRRIPTPVLARPRPISTAIPRITRVPSSTRLPALALSSLPTRPVPSRPTPVAIAYNAFGEQRLRQNRYYEADFAFSRSGTSNATALVNQALSRSYRGRTAEAQQILQQAIALNPAALKCYIVPPEAADGDWQPEQYLRTGESCLSVFFD